LQRIAPIPKQLLSVTLHLSYPTVTQGHKLTGVTHIAKLTNAHRHHTYSQIQQSSGIPPVAKPTVLTGIPPVAKPTKLTDISPVAKPRIMHTSFTPAAYYEPN
jgi:hypothetical protein